MNSDKPKYMVPSMAEVEALPWNGRTVISTFSGGGGSTMGYKMAGYKVAIACEFMETARATYSANFPGTPIEPRDIREVTGAGLLSMAGIAVGQLDIFDGSPPCSSFSMSGSRDKGWGSVKKYGEGAQRTDDLFFEYTRVLKEMQPKAFIAENVSGLVMGSAKGYFKQILQRLKSCGYKVSARVLDASWLGVPQARRRLIFVGIRDDIPAEPSHPRPLAYQYVLRDGMPWVDGEGLCPLVEPETNSANSKVGREWPFLAEGQASAIYFNLIRCARGRPCFTILATGGNGATASVMHPLECRKFSIAELLALSSFPADFKTIGTYAQRYERIGRAVPPVLMSHVARHVNEILTKAGV